MKSILKIIIDIIFIIYILIIPMWIIELLNIDLIKIHESILNKAVEKGQKVNMKNG